MILPIKRIPEGHSLLSQVVELNEEQAKWLRTKKIQCHAEIDRIRSQVHVRIFYEGKVSVDCSRCLTPIEFPIKGEFRIVCVHRSDTGNDGTFNEDEIDFVFDDSTDDLDATALIYEEIMIALPMKPLCSDDCSGFSDYIKNIYAKSVDKITGTTYPAAKRGVSFYDGGTEVVVENDAMDAEIPNDPRWDALKKLKKQGR